MAAFDVHNTPAVPDLSFCLGVLKHRAPLAVHLSAKEQIILRWIFAYVVQF
jgi:hypothetical protein